jgi:ribonuclease R
MTVAPDTTERILAALKARAESGLRQTELRRELGVRTREELVQFRLVFRRLLAEGLVSRRRHGRYTVAEETGLVSGRITMHGRGFGFVRLDRGGADVFIPAHATDLAVSGDRVLVALSRVQDERGPSGAVRSILARGREEVTGEFVRDGDRCFVRPLRKDFPSQIPVPDANLAEEGTEAQHGDWVTATLCRPRYPGGELTGALVRHVAKGNTVDGDLDAVIAEYGLLPRYSAVANATAAARLPASVPRQELLALPVITIDPEDAKDFDDALSAELGPAADTVVIGVHIADVAAYVEPESELDFEARQRGFTAYIPGRTLPMLPESLASDRCSLREGEERLTHSLFFTLDRASGQVRSSRRCHTLVRVRRRLTFQEVQEFLDGTPPADLPRDVLPTLRLLQEMYLVLRRARAAAEQFLALATTETRVRCTERPARVLGLFREEPNQAHALVEEFMLAANTAVAEELLQAELPGLFRVHADPKSTDLDEFRTWAEKSLALKPGRLGSRQALNRFLQSVSRLPTRDLATNALLRALPRAAYSASVQPHFGLGKSRYCHFTSPIRRYPDLVVHQQLWARDTSRQARTQAECTELATHCSQAETNVDDAYYAANDRLKLRYIRDLVETGDRVFFEGIIARHLRDACLVFLPDVGIFGLLPWAGLRRERSPGGRRDRDGSGRRRATGGCRCGDVIYVRVRRIDVVKGVFELQPLHGRPTQG